MMHSCCRLQLPLHVYSGIKRDTPAVFLETDGDKFHPLFILCFAYGMQNIHDVFTWICIAMQEIDTRVMRKEISFMLQLVARVCVSTCGITNSKMGFFLEFTMFPGLKCLHCCWCHVIYLSISYMCLWECKQKGERNAFFVHAFFSHDVFSYFLFSLPRPQRTATSTISCTHPFLLYDRFILLTHAAHACTQAPCYSISFRQHSSFIHGTSVFTLIHTNKRSQRCRIA